MTGMPPPTAPVNPTNQGPAPPGISGGATGQTQQGLPPTGLQQQMEQLNQLYERTQNATVSQAGAPSMFGVGFNPTRGIGFNVRQSQFEEGQATMGGQGLQGQQMGSGSIDQLAQNLAQRYGLPIGRGRLFDEQGNPLLTPQQIADASGGSVTLGEASVMMGHISQAISRFQNERQQQRGISAIEAGMGQVQSRGRGSLASVMMGSYRDLADLYSNQQFESFDFSDYIQMERDKIAMELQRRSEKLAKKRARMGVVGGVVQTVVGLYSGDVATAGQGVNTITQNAADTGWF